MRKFTLTWSPLEDITQEVTEGVGNDYAEKCEVFALFNDKEPEKPKFRVIVVSDNSHLDEVRKQAYKALRNYINTLHMNIHNRYEVLFNNENN